MSIPCFGVRSDLFAGGRWNVGVVGDPLAESRRERREQYRADDRRPERGAEVLGGALEPAPLAALGGRDGGHDDVPELRGEQAAARADDGECDLEAGVVQRHVERRQHHDRADADRDQPKLRDGTRRAPGRDPRPQQREDEHRHRQREQALAGLERVEAQHDLQVHGDDEEGAHQDELLPQQAREPCAQLRDPQQRRVEQLVPAEAGATLLPDEERPEQREAAEHQERHRREAKRRDLRAVDGRRRSRLDEPPDAAAQDREHDQAEPARRERHADEVEPRAPLGGRSSGNPPAKQQEEDHDDGLAGKHVAPRELGRHPSADERARSDGDGGDAAEQRVGQRALAALVAGGGERRDRGNHEHRTEPLDPRPADQQDGEVRTQRRGQRPGAVDRQADRERRGYGPGCRRASRRAA